MKMKTNIQESESESAPVRRSTRARSLTVPFGSNDIRLSLFQWAGVLGVFVSLLIVVPLLWKRFEPFHPGPRYRIPETLSYDYWIFSRYAQWASTQDELLVLGDSVIWGQYVQPRNAFSSFIREQGGIRCGNLGVNGLHPAALEGLVRHYGHAISGNNVIVHCNLLWMSSDEHDLRIEKEFHFNHPGLVPQFVPRIPCYKEKYSRRIGIVVGRTVGFLAWTSHLRIAYFGNMDIPHWTVENPYRNPFDAFCKGLPVVNDGPRKNAIPWTQKHIPVQDLPWVHLKDSLQWHSFQKTIEVLQTRKNRIFVVVGPFNTHMLARESLQRYRNLKHGVVDWLSKRKIAHFVPPTLPSDYYADASHPLAEGYSMLATQLLESETFRRFIGSDK